jgi:hypothetical protein
MRLRTFGGDPAGVSEVGLGCWQIGGDQWGDVPDADALATLRAAVEAGVTFLDTADIYGAGRSETLVGRLLRERPGPLFIATKLGRFPTPGLPLNCTPENMRKHTEASLQRLGVDALDELLTNQHYRLADWRVAGAEINYRRFFDQNTLAAIRMEREDVFEETHRLLFDLAARGIVTGVRVDHVDGLYAPGQYLERLQAGLAHATADIPDAEIPVFVEKILEEGERLPREWPISGTTGYEAMAEIDRLPAAPARRPGPTCSSSGSPSGLNRYGTNRSGRWRAKRSPAKSASSPTRRTGLRSGTACTATTRSARSATRSKGRLPASRCTAPTSAPTTGRSTTPPTSTRRSTKRCAATRTSRRLRSSSCAKCSSSRRTG